MNSMIAIALNLLKLNLSFELIDKRATGSSSFVLSAYLFKEGGIVYLSTQIKLAHQIKDFTKHDFEKKRHY